MGGSRHTTTIFDFMDRREIRTSDDVLCNVPDAPGLVHDASTIPETVNLSLYVEASKKNREKPDMRELTLWISFGSYMGRPTTFSILKANGRISKVLNLDLQM